MGDELYCVDADGKAQDANLHEGLLNNPRADLICRRQSFLRAVAGGISREIAVQLYGADAAGF
jgi:hypothetical protein